MDICIDEVVANNIDKLTGINFNLHYQKNFKFKIDKNFYDENYCIKIISFTYINVKWNVKKIFPKYMSYKNYWYKPNISIPIIIIFLL